MATGGITHHDATANGVRLHYTRAGDGPAVVLLHGWPEFWYGWRKTMPALAEAGFTAIAPDMRGYGTSDKPETGYDKRTVAADIFDLMTSLGFDRFAVVGHDWGGAVAEWLLLDHPEQVTKFCIINMVYMPGMFAEGAPPPQEPDVIAQSWYQHFHRLPNHVAERLVEGREEVYLGHIIRTWSKTEGVFTEDDLARYVEAYRQPGALTGGFNYYREMGNDVLGLMAHKDTRPEQPTLVIWGMDDPVLRPTGIAAFERCFPNLTVVRIDGCGHFPAWERPDIVNEALAGFLRG